MRVLRVGWFVFTSLSFAAMAWASEPTDQAPVAPNLVQCRSRDGTVVIEFPQPDQSTFATGPGECWLSLMSRPAVAPLRLYVRIAGPGDQAGHPLRTDDPQAAAQWARDNRVFRREVEVVDSRILTVGATAIPYHVLRGRPADTLAEREAVIAHVQRGGHDVIIALHYDAHNRQSLQERALGLFETMTFGPGELEPAPEPEKQLPSSPPAALGRIPVDTVREIPLETEESTE